MYCYSAFLADREEFSPPTPPSPMYSFTEEKQENVDEQDAGKLWGRKWKNRVMPSDSDDEGIEWEAHHKTHQPLGPRTAGDGSDNPDELTAAASNNKFSSTQVTGMPVLQAGNHKRERSGAIFKRYLDVHASTSQVHRPLGPSISHPVPRSKSMEGIATAASASKFHFRPQKILEAAMRIGQGSKSGSVESLDTLPTEKEKKQGPLKKLLKESSIPVLGAHPKKQRAAPLDLERAPSPVTQPLKPDDPCAPSDMDPPSNLDKEALVEGASSVSDLQCPLSDAILTLLCELLKERGSWLTVDRVQQGFSATLGGLLEWYGMGRFDS